MLLVSFQEQPVSVPSLLGHGVSYSNINKRGSGNYNGWKANHGLGKIFFQKVPIDRATKKFEIL
jgi:hypothetical protein